MVVEVDEIHSRQYLMLRMSGYFTGGVEYWDSVIILLISAKELQWFTNSCNLWKKTTAMIIRVVCDRNSVPFE
jgi:hypothetical protein